jgi:RNA polymerase sigma factor (sigma-70 family)
VDADARFEDVWRRSAPDVLAVLARRSGDFGDAEEAVQEALIAASRQWPVQGTPDYPTGWLLTVATRRLTDRRRSDASRTERERAMALRTGPGAFLAPGADETTPSERDDSLTLLLLCCHPALTRPSRVALTLRAVAGLSTAQIARAFLVPEATMAQRISRAKGRLRETGARFTLPSPEEMPGRVAAATDVLFLIFTEGHTSTTGRELTDVSLATEAIRLTRRLYGHLPTDTEVMGLPPRPPTS